jgi:hypothetical protein
MAFTGKKFKFFGLFKSKAKARKREKQVGGFIIKRRVCRKKKCRTGYLVAKKRG